MDTVTLVPTCTQVVPFGEMYAVKTLPVRIKLTQYGALPVTPPPEPFAEAGYVSGVTRSMRVDWFGIQYTMPSLAPGLKLSRIITPTCGHEAPCTLATRAVIEPSPANVW